MSASAVESVLAELTERRVPGLAAVVVRDGIAESAPAGVADRETGAPITGDTGQLWFSMTKIVTATAVMQLAESGQLDLEDPVTRFLPEFPEPRGGWPPVQVRHLLSHSSGLANPIPVRWVRPATEPRPDSRAFTLDQLARNGKLRFPAGDRASYSNLGYLALGEVIAAVTGRSFEEYVTASILEPLAMTRTGFTFEGLGDDVATGYQPRLHPMTPLFRLLLPRGIVGAPSGRFLAFNRFYVDGPAYGGLIGSAADAARFMTAHLNGGELDGRRLLSPEAVAEMQTIRARGRRLQVGYGWTRRGTGDDGHLEHLGGGGGFWTMMRIHPDRGAGVLSMGNATRYDHERIARAALAQA